MNRSDRLSSIAGPNLAFRLIRPGDADYVFGLRTDPDYNLYLSKVQGTVEDQRRWIERYVAREADGGELYYVIERRDGRPCGVVRLYEIGPRDFTWGSWVLDASKPAKAALESAYLIYVIAFDRLGLAAARFEVRRDNVRTISFHEKFGAQITGSNGDSLQFVYPREQFQVDRARYLALLERGRSSLHPSQPLPSRG